MATERSDRTNDQRRASSERKPLKKCHRDYPMNGHEWMRVETIDAIVDRVNELSK